MDRPIATNTLVANDRKSTQRERLIASMVAVASREGYAHANVSAVIARAGVSRPTFYDYFENREACLLAAHRDAAGRLLGQVRLSVKQAPPEQALQSAASALWAFASAMPDQAMLLLDATMAGGPRALDERDRTIFQIERVIERGRAKAPADARTPDLPTRALIGAICWLLPPLLRRGERDLTGMAGDFNRWIESYERPAGEHRWHRLDPGAVLLPSRHVSELSLDPPPPIPPGRSRLAPREIARNQRERILFAIAEMATRKGYAATTIADIAATASVDKNVFYSHFRDKRQAFLAVHELGLQQTLAVAVSAFFSAPTWPERIWEVIRASTQFLASHPTIARVGFVESHAVGAPAVQRLDDSRMAFTIFLQEGYRHTIRPPTRVALEAISAAIFELNYRQVRGSQQLPRMACHMAYLALAPFLEPDAADELIDAKLREDLVDVAGQLARGREHGLRRPARRGR